MPTDDERREAAWLPEGTDPMPGIPEVRVLDEDGKEVFRGYYYRHLNRQVAPIRDSLRPEDVDHCVVHDDFADWNMPQSFRATKITPPHRIEIVRDIDRDALLELADKLEAFTPMNCLDCPANKDKCGASCASTVAKAASLIIREALGVSE